MCCFANYAIVAVPLISALRKRIAATAGKNRLPELFAQQSTASPQQGLPEQSREYYASFGSCS